MTSISPSQAGSQARQQSRKSQQRKVRIIADHRERAVIPALQASVAQDGDNLDLMIAMLGYGDYSIVIFDNGATANVAIAPAAVAPAIASVAEPARTTSSTTSEQREVAIIERKTYADFASSIIDRRIDNIPDIIAEINKRESRAYCRVYLLLEGDLPYNPQEKISGITMRAIRAKINHMM